MLRPLPTRKHVLHYGGRLDASQFGPKLTFHLTVECGRVDSELASGYLGSSLSTVVSGERGQPKRREELSHADTKTMGERRTYPAAEASY
jgi:hypothetical protein